MCYPDQARGSIQIEGGGGITKLDVDEDVTLADAKEDMDVVVQVRLAESQEIVYHLHLQRSEKVLSMQDTDEAKPTEVGIASKLMTEVVTTTATTITAAQVPKASAPSAPITTAGVSVSTAKPSTPPIITTTVIEDKDLTIAQTFMKIRTQARKNMIIYLKNMARFNMDFFKGMTYNDIRSIFEKHYNSIQAFLEKKEEAITVQEKRQGKHLEKGTSKKQRVDEDKEELKRHLQIELMVMMMSSLKLLL
nr:hypothetical protein [Tanacetum cinerariifolium]